MFSIEYRYFYQAGVDKSVRKAANSLNINSSAVVRQIHKLEDNLNMKLFDRSSKGLSLTNEGKVVFKFVSEQLEKNELLDRNFFKIVLSRSLEKLLVGTSTYYCIWAR